MLAKTKATRVMLDLETLSTNSNAAILSIGAVVFNPDTGLIGSSFYTAVNLASCEVAGLHVCQNTLNWWAKQSDEARAVFYDPNQVALGDALHHFAKFLSSVSDTYKGKYNVQIWGNGSDFDNVILANAYKTMGFDAPWHYYNNRCYRTFKECFGAHWLEPARTGTYHNALDDAIHQATVVNMTYDAAMKSIR